MANLLLKEEYNLFFEVFCLGSTKTLTKSVVRDEKTFLKQRFFEIFFLLGGLEALLPRYLSRYPQLIHYSQ